MECWNGVLEWSTGMDSLEWSEALEWVCDYFGGKVLAIMVEYEEGIKPVTLACMDTFVNQNTQKWGEPTIDKRL